MTIDPMKGLPRGGAPDFDVAETQEWIEALGDVVRAKGAGRAQFLLQKLLEEGYERGVQLPFSANTPYLNTIPPAAEPEYPGNRAVERRIKSLVRWNALAMVVRANRQFAGIGGHISTYASAATLYEVGFQHFFRGRGDDGFAGDHVFFQGHASPGIYARAFLEGRISREQMEAFRRELAPGGGLASYPHPYLMSEFWEYPTVSMGLGPINAIYQARFNRYLHDRGLVDTSRKHVWAFLGDGETDEPESLGAISLAARERLDNLIFVINCNLQRLDGPVRGNGKIIQELEAIFRGTGWNVIKVIWGSDWDPLLAAESTGLLIQRMNEVVDGELQKYVVEDGAYVRRTFFGKYPELARLVEQLSDDEIWKLRRGGHDPRKVHAAYREAVDNEGSPTVILAQTIKGYGLGEAGEGRNVTHQQKKLNDEELRLFRDRFDIPISDRELAKTPFYRPPESSEEIQYLLERRRALGGFVPSRRPVTVALPVPAPPIFGEFDAGSEREVSTTMAFVRMLALLLKDPELGRRVVPVVPDEARTFGMESLFRQYGIYSSVGQLYEPVDAKTLLYYKEAKNGQILEEGITEAGSMASFTAAGTSAYSHGFDTIPFFIFYSMFGFQRVGDLVWAAADQGARGFMLGATSGRTTLNGEGLQHEDGHSHVLAATVPNLIAYDPAYAYELAAILLDGLRRMLQARENVFYYVTLYNENYAMAPKPAGSDEGILRGLYPLRAGDGDADWARVHLLGSGSLLREALRAQEILRERYQVRADVWSATSYKELRREALEVERWNLLHPAAERRRPYVERVLAEAGAGAGVPVVAVSDFMKLVPDQIARWVPAPFVPLGTDGFGRSETREALRRFFEVDAEHVALAALRALAGAGAYDVARAAAAVGELGLDAEKSDPVRS
jgi:pyruvate dehydrogenase E1 component